MHAWNIGRVLQILRVRACVIPIFPGLLTYVEWTWKNVFLKWTYYTEDNSWQVFDKNGRPLLSSQCKVYDTEKSRILKAQKSEGTLTNIWRLSMWFISRSELHLSVNLRALKAQTLLWKKRRFAIFR